MRRKISAVLTSLAMILLGTITIAPPASAASGGTFCFKHQDDTPYVNKPVYIQVSSDGNYWYGVLDLRTGADGCGWFSFTGDIRNYYVQAWAQWDLYSPEGKILQRHQATSPLWGTPGDQQAHLGTGIVLCASWDYSAPCR